jgi:CDP-ribitol ribitolphosphotransferase
MKNVKDNLDDRIILNPKINYAELLKIADYVITDYSALMVEAAIMKTNILLYVYDYEQYSVENGLNINLFEELPGCVFKEWKDIMKVIDENSYNRKVLFNFRNKYITNLEGNSTKKIYNLIKGAVENEKS